VDSIGGQGNSIAQSLFNKYEPKLCNLVVNCIIKYHTPFYNTTAWFLLPSSCSMTAVMFNSKIKHNIPSWLLIMLPRWCSWNHSKQWHTVINLAHAGARFW